MSKARGSGVRSRKKHSHSVSSCVSSLASGGVSSEAVRQALDEAAALESRRSAVCRLFVGRRAGVFSDSSAISRAREDGTRIRLIGASKNLANWRRTTSDVRFLVRLAQFLVFSTS